MTTDWGGCVDPVRLAALTTRTQGPAWAEGAVGGCGDTNKPSQPVRLATLT